MTSKSTIGVLAILPLLFVSGCMPEAKPPEIKGPLETNKATQLQSKVRSRHGDKYSVDHKIGDKEFTANWEISNSLKRIAKVQIKPPREGWEVKDLYGALDVVMQAHDTKPWYGQIDETVMTLLPRAVQDPEGLVVGYPEGTPYHVQLKLKEHTAEWFLEVKVQILSEDGTNIGF